MKNLIRKILKEGLVSEVGSKRAKDTDVIYNDGKVVIVVPRTYESCLSYSQNTQYCTRSKHMYDRHSKSGDDMFRIFFKDGTKIRLTWMPDGNFHWGLGRKEDYHYFGPNNFDSKDPFNFGSLVELRKEQLKIKKNTEKFNKWVQEFMERRGYEIVTNEYGMKHYADVSEGDMEIYNKKHNSLIGDKSYWWSEGKDKLLNYMKALPKDAMDEMYEYHYAEKRY